MVELISTFGISSILIILIVAIPAIFGVISWCKKLWALREQFKKDQQKQGRQALQEEEAEEQRFCSGETRIAQLELIVAQQAELIKAMKTTNERLIRSDRLAIKTYIKEQHDIWVPKGCIDGQVLDLLEERFAIYQEEGGNSWALRLMQDLRALPVATIVPFSENHE